MCVNLLCALDSNLAILPADATTFFEAVVQDAVQSPTFDTLWRLYDLLRGPCQSFQELLRPELRSQLEEQMRLIMKRQGLEAQSTSLLCLGIIKELSATDDTGVEPSKRKSARAQELFDTPGTRSAASLSLIALQAVWYCGKSTLSVREASRMLSLAISVAQRVSKEALSEWASSKKGQDSLGHLVRKCVQDGVDAEIHIKVCEIAFSHFRHRADLMSRYSTFFRFSTRFTSCHLR